MILQRDVAHIVTDSAFYDLDGYVQGFAPKAVTIPHWPGILAVRGPMLGMALLLAEASIKFRNIDEFADGAEAFLADYCKRHHEALTQWGGPPAIEVHAVGVSPSTGGCRGFYVNSQPGEEDPDTLLSDDFDYLSAGPAPVVALTEVNVPDIIVAPLPPDEFWGEVRASGFGGNLAALDHSAIRRLGTKILKAQRLETGTHFEGGEHHHFVGGFPVFMTLKRDGTITTSIGEAWADKVGERIDPSQDREAERDAAPDLAHMSRQQRRQFERLKRERSAA
ncbi:hypothetical protein [Methylobacterium soli]|uniref:hypothetical protein n=1 Tax=Methylobacterium soli TaxID=553447 RepID=UPI0012451B31|nr:hypothetical protein [Methylobacterium soli]